MVNFPTLSTSYFVNSHFVNSHFVNIAEMGIDKVGIDEVGINRQFTPVFTIGGPLPVL